MRDPYQPVIRRTEVERRSERIGHVISRIDLRGDALPEGPALRALLPRADFDVAAALEKVRPICEDVHHRGDAALIEYAEKFDGVRLDQVRVPAAALKEALAGLDPLVREALEESIRRARLVHSAQRRAPHTVQVVPGGKVTEKWVPVERVAALCPRRPLRLPLLRDHERRPGAGGGRRVDGARVPAAGRLRRTAAPDDPRRLRAPRHRRGVRRRPAPRPSRCSRTAPRPAPRPTW